MGNALVEIQNENKCLIKVLYFFQTLIISMYRYHPHPRMSSPCSTHAFGGASNETLMKLSREATEISIASLESLTASKETLMRRLWVFSFSNFSQSYYNRLLVKIVLQYNFGKVSRDMNMTVQRVF